MSTVLYKLGAGEVPEVMEIEVSELVFLGLLFIGWQLGRVATAIKSVAVELTTARWERSHREALKRDSEDQREAALPLGRQFTDR